MPEISPRPVPIAGSRAVSQPMIFQVPLTPVRALENSLLSRVESRAQGLHPQGSHSATGLQCGVCSPSRLHSLLLCHSKTCPARWPGTVNAAVILLMLWACLREESWPAHQLQNNDTLLLGLPPVATHQGPPAFGAQKHEESRHCCLETLPVPTMSTYS